MDLRDRKLGDIIRVLELVDDAQREEAVAYARSHGCPLGRALLAIGVIDESILVQALAAQAGVPMVTLVGVTPAPSVLATIPGIVAARLGAVPIGVLETT